MISGGLTLLHEMKNLLPPSEQKIADYILSNPEIAVRMTVSELAEKSYTSTAAVTRLCKSLNIDGFQDLKLRVNGDLIQGGKTQSRDIEPNEPVGKTIEKVTTLAMEALRETAELLSNNELTKAVEAILECRSVHFFGVGASAICAMDAQQKFLRINKPSTAFTDIHMGATIVANAGPEDVVVGISFSGETVEVVRIMELAKEKGVKTISLTKYGLSTISNIADISLTTSPTKEANFRSGATSSRLAQLHVMDILFMSVASRQYNKTIEYLDNTRKAIYEMQESVVKKKKK
ncbi:MurR/RpiR family transcriptional regulator [Sporosarcina sp. Te-1]|uniref:MurR/RpiR family transcriptional regulator n=1 Tax=Sporosarcina sp. Te-1 TaxID=2818390 RepID=UPI001FB0CBF3|nr:MurR/RpiR family transcriptional regulator [Sporosarcina sp. Te-1]